MVYGLIGFRVAGPVSESDLRTNKIKNSADF